MKDKISIIIKTFNNDEIITRSINTVLNQTINNFEIVIIDNHSTDNTYKLLKKIKDKRLKIIRLRKKIEDKYLNNLALKEVSGKYITFLDINNNYRLDKLEHQLENIINNNSDIDICRSIIHNKDNIIIQNNNNIFDELSINNIISIDCFLIKKSILKKIIFDENLDSLQDLDFIIRVINKGIVTNTCEVLIDIYKDKEVINKESIINILKKDYKIDIKNSNILDDYLIRNLYDNKLNNLIIKYNELKKNYTEKELELNNILNSKRLKFINKILKVIGK